MGGPRAGIACEQNSNCLLSRTMLQGTANENAIAYGMAMAHSLERGERLLLLLSPEELVAIEEYRRKHQLSSRSEAIHTILRRSLAVSEKAPARTSPPARPVVKPAADAMPMTKPMTKPWHRAKRRSLNDI